MQWSKEDEGVVRDIHQAVSRYVDSFYQYNDHLRRLSMRYRIPIIVLSALSSGTSFGNIGLSPKLQRGLNIATGSISLIVTILTAIEGYLKLPILTNQTDKVMLELGKISHGLYTTLSLDPTKRDTPDKVITNAFIALGTALAGSPVIPASRLAKIKRIIEKESVYSLFPPPRHRLPADNNV